MADETRQGPVAGDFRMTTMGLSVGDGEIYTCVPEWDDEGRPCGIAVRTVPEATVDVAALTSSAPQADSHSVKDLTEAVWKLHQGQRKLTPAFASSYIDKPIRTFFARNWVPSTSLDPKQMMGTAALANYALGRSRGEDIGLVEKAYREWRHVLADLATQVWVALGEADADGDSEVAALVDAIKTPSDAALWVEGASWLCCWHDHMHTKKDISSKLLREWFSQVESPLKVKETASRAQFLSPEGIEATKAIGLQCIRRCWVISDADGEVTDVMESEQAWEEALGNETAMPEPPSMDQIIAKTKQAAAAEEANEEEEEDDVLPDEFRSRLRQLDELTPDEGVGRPGEE